jgi:hypothetical protein
MLPLKRVRASEAGGLMVVPGTNNDLTQQQLRERYPHVEQVKGDWKDTRMSNKLRATGWNCHPMTP